MKRARLGVIAVIAATSLAAAACGGPPAVTAGASRALSTQVQLIRTDAVNGDPTSATRDLDRLRQMVDDYRQGGEITDARATAILATASQVSTDLSALTPPTTEAPPDTPAPAVPVAHKPPKGHHGDQSGPAGPGPGGGDG